MPSTVPPGRGPTHVGNSRTLTVLDEDRRLSEDVAVLDCRWRDAVYLSTAQLLGAELRPAADTAKVS
jgi:hypothetical protein